MLTAERETQIADATQIFHGGAFYSDRWNELLADIEAEAELQAERDIADAQLYHGATYHTGPIDSLDESAPLGWTSVGTDHD